MPPHQRVVHEMPQAAWPQRIKPWIRTREEWDQWYSRPNPWGYEGTDRDFIRKNQIFKRLRYARFVNTLDLGCGEGGLTDVLSRSSQNTWGVDISFNAIERARERFPHINFLQGDIVDVCHGSRLESIPFDLIVASEVLYYLDVGEERYRTLAGLARMGAPACLYLFACVVTGPTSERAYFTHSEFVRMLSEHFNLIDWFPAELRQTRVVKWLSHLLRQRDLRLPLLEFWTNSRGPEACKSIAYFAVKRATAHGLEGYGLRSALSLNTRRASAIPRQSGTRIAGRSA